MPKAVLRRAPVSASLVTISRAIGAPAQTMVSSAEKSVAG